MSNGDSVETTDAVDDLGCLDLLSEFSQMLVPVADCRPIIVETRACRAGFARFCQPSHSFNSSSGSGSKKASVILISPFMAPKRPLSLGLQRTIRPGAARKEDALLLRSRSDVVHPHRARHQAQRDENEDGAIEAREDNLVETI